MPILQPAEPWKRTGRYGIDELFKLEDRKGAEMVLAMTHEEALTYHVAREVRSYRDLPLILYQIQTKERDEPRPRAGVLRTREFRMKDAYSFDRDEEGLQRSYDLHIEAYDRIFDRCGLRWYRVESDVGMMGGSGAHEYMAPCPAGENEVALAPGYAANVEVASAEPQPFEAPPALEAPESVCHPGPDHGRGGRRIARGRRRVAAEGDAGGRRGARVPAGAGARRSSPQRDQAQECARARPFGPRGRTRSSNTWGRPASSARSAPRSRSSRTRRSTATPSSPAPTRQTLTCAGCGRAATSPSRRWTSAPSRPATPPPVGARSRSSPRSRSATSSSSEPRYSEPLGATYLDESGSEQPIVMGSYGIGPARIVAAAIEQSADEKGIVWPRSLAPWQAHLVSLGEGRRGRARGRRPPLRGAVGGGAPRFSTTIATADRGRS